MTTSAPQSPATSTVPVPPQGPGAVVPFAAPPRDPDKSRMTMGIIIGVVAFILVCGGAGAAALGVLMWSSSELSAQSRDAADEFLQNIADDNYPKAYKSLCEPTRDNLSQRKFTSDWQSLEVESAKTIGISSGQKDLVVRAEVTSAEGIDQEIDLTVVLGQKNMTMQVCDWKAVQ